MTVGKMTLHRFNGDEIYTVESATIEHYKAADGSFTVTFRAETGSTPIQTLSDTEELKAQPWAEWTLTLSKTPAIALRPGGKFSIPEGHSAEAGYVTNLYYCEHETMDENEIEVIERDGLRVRARITGMATDVNYYDGSKPRTKVVVEADFTLGI
jgi:hypothetical protein